MKRPLVWTACSFAAGIISTNLFNHTLLLITGISIIAVLIVASMKIYIRHCIIYCILAAAFAAGAVEVHLIDGYYGEGFRLVSDKKISMEIRIDSEPDIREGKVIYTARIIKAEPVNADLAMTESGRYGNEYIRLRGKVRLTHYAQPEDRIFSHGDVIRLEEKITLPSAARNPGAFDYARYLKTSGVYALINTSTDRMEYVGEYRGNFLTTVGLKIRKRVVDVINRCLPPDQAGLLNGMMIGTRDGLSEKIKENFTNCGLAHLTAVSGMNVAFLMAPFLWLFKRIRLNEKLSCLITIIVLIIFLFTTGLSPSIFRAVIMGCLYLLSKIVNRDTDVFTSIAFAALVILVLNPFSLYDVGFQLSFAGTLSLVLLSKSIRKFISFIPGTIGDATAVCIAAQIGVTPVSALYFNKVSIISLFSNLLVAPLVEGVTILGFMMAVIGQIWLFPAKILGGINYFLLSFILLITNVSAKIPYATVQVVTPSFIFLAVYYVIVLLVFVVLPDERYRLHRKHACLAAVYVLILLSPLMLLNNGLRVIFADVGQGDCILIQTPDSKNVLVDGGGTAFSPEDGFDVGTNTVIPFLLDMGVSNIDVVMATHMHADHIAGLLPVIRTMRSGMLVIPEITAESEGLNLLLEAAQEKSLEIIRVSRGDTIRIGRDAILEILNPPEAPDKNYSENNNSIVSRLVYNNKKILLTGDIEKEAERDIITEGLDIDSDVMKAAHHGSNTSSTDEFLDRVTPSLGIISVGKNRYGHPSEETLENFVERGIPILRTDLHGGITVTVKHGRIRVRKTIAFE